MDWGTPTIDKLIGTIPADGFWPAVDGDAFARDYMLPAELPATTIMAFLQRGFLWACSQLDAYERSSEYETLADEPQRKIANTPAKVLAFNRAVCCFAKAEILLETMTAARRKEADNLAKTGTETEDRYREYANDALRMITECGRPAGVELI